MLAEVKVDRILKKPGAWQRRSREDAHRPLEWPLQPSPDSPRVPRCSCRTWHAFPPQSAYKQPAEEEIEIEEIFELDDYEYESQPYNEDEAAMADLEIDWHLTDS